MVFKTFFCIVFRKKSPPGYAGFFIPKAVRMGKIIPEKKPANFVDAPLTFMITFSPHQIFLNKCPNLRKKLLVPCILDPPSANCYVCASKPEVTVKLNVQKTMVLTLQDRVTQGGRSLTAFSSQCKCPDFCPSPCLPPIGRS